VLAACGHDILGAQVYTAKGSLAVEIYEVRPLEGEEPEREQERARLEQSLAQVISGERTVEALLAGRPAEGPAAARQVPPSVDVSNDESDFYTVVDVTTNDRPALLHDITRALFELDLNVVMSRASTRARRATDAFYVTRRGHKITAPGQVRAIEEKLLGAIRRGAV
jgi:[protein-PII] uridylyltransferase